MKDHIFSKFFKWNNNWYLDMDFRSKYVACTLWFQKFKRQLGVFFFWKLYRDARKCVYVRFPPSKRQLFFWKVSVNSWLIGLDQLYTGRAGESSREKPFHKILSRFSWCFSRDVVVTKRPGALTAPSWFPGRTYFFFFFFPCDSRIRIRIHVFAANPRSRQLAFKE